MQAPSLLLEVCDKRGLRVSLSSCGFRHLRLRGFDTPAVLSGSLVLVGGLSPPKFLRTNPNEDVRENEGNPQALRLPTDGDVTDACGRRVHRSASRMKSFFFTFCACRIEVSYLKVPLISTTRSLKSSSSAES